MPVVDVQVVAEEGSQTEPTAAFLANALALVFKVQQPGRVWVRLSVLPASAYAENGINEAHASAPVFVRVLHADLPSPDALAQEAKDIAHAVAACVARSVQQVHVEYWPAGRGRVAFGGALLT